MFGTGKSKDSAFIDGVRQVVRGHRIDKSTIAQAREFVDLADFEDQLYNPFYKNNTNSGWLIASCAAGMIGTIAMGYMLVSAFSNNNSLPLTNYNKDLIAQTSSPVTKETFTTHKLENINTTLNLKTISNNKSDAFKIVDDSVNSHYIASTNELFSTDKYNEVTMAFRALQDADNISIPNLRNHSNEEDYSKRRLVRTLVPSYMVGSAELEDSTTEISMFGNFNLVPQSPIKINITTNNNIIPKASLENKPSRDILVAYNGIVKEKISIDGSSQNLINALLERKIDNSQAIAMVKALERNFSPKEITKKQIINLKARKKLDANNSIMNPIEMSLPISDDRSVIVRRSESGGFVSDIVDANGDKVIKSKDRIRTIAKIDKNLYLTAKQHSVPETIIREMIRIHSYDVDFQREIKPGDSFEIFYGKAKNNNSKKVVLYSSLTLKGRKKGYYRFVNPVTGKVGYYDESGSAVTKFLMLTPVDGARISSRFGRRRHPILGYTKMHTGIDFAAARGTPIKASGAGTIEKIGRAGGYGKYIRIKHSNGYKTAYAHMSRFARNLRNGSRVYQGQVIGYVGSTGRSTGPHLHYEVIRDGRKINPNRLKAPVASKLSGKYMAMFKKEKKKILAMMRSTPTATQIAQTSRTNTAIDN